MIQRLTKTTPLFFKFKETVNSYNLASEGQVVKGITLSVCLSVCPSVEIHVWPKKLLCALTYHICTTRRLHDHSLTMTFDTKDKFTDLF